MAALYLALVGDVVYGDAWKRVEIASRILFSRDPHLAAIGFIWSPLPVLATVPVVPLKEIWPQLTTFGLAGCVISSLCMAAAGVQVNRLLAEAGLGRGFTWTLTAAFALNPLTVMYAANGMSEAMLIFFLICAARFLARWFRDGRVNSLVATGLFLGFAYLTRYESIGAAASVTAVVGVVSYMRIKRGGGQISAVVCDVVIVAAPWMFAFVMWAVASWLITGEPFSQFASDNGNSSIYVNRTRVATGYASWSGPVVRLVVTQLLLLAPALPVLPILRVRRLRRPAVALAVASAACLGGPLTFIVAAQISGQLAHELRYLIAIVPLTVLFAGVCIAANRGIGRPRRGATIPSLMAAAVLFAALPTSAVAMLDGTTDSWHNISTASLISADAQYARGGRLNWPAERAVASDLDARHLPDGAVLVDDFLGYPIVMLSSNQRQFVITSDRDFLSKLADPKNLAVRYILVPAPSGLGTLDAINRQYPGLYATGDGFASLVGEYAGTGANGMTWRLYELT